jgi:membrane protein DedA with SNARE-associated domain
MDLQQLIFDYGDWFYPCTFLWTFLEGETFVIFAGYAAEQGLLSLWKLVLAAWLGSFAGDQFYFFIGRRFGHRLLKRFPKWRPGVESALGFLHKYNTYFILSFRFVYGVRNFSSFAMGMSGLPWIRFFGLNLIAAGAWACTFAGVGYLFGHAFEAILGQAARDVGLALLAAFLIATWLGLRAHLRRQKREAAAKAASPKAAGPGPL